ncbi:MAG: WD40/YVTN/BNR-like repeat-containing protein [Candidatus Rokuibacteriota bacterium]
MGGLPAGTVNGFAVDPKNPKVTLVAMRDGILRSEDGGGRWTSAHGGPTNAGTVAINPERPTEAYATTMEGQLFASRDGGQTWRPVR